MFCDRQTQNGPLKHKNRVINLLLYDLAFNGSLTLHRPVMLQGISRGQSLFDVIQLGQLMGSAAGQFDKSVQNWNSILNEAN